VRNVRFSKHEAVAKTTAVVEEIKRLGDDGLSFGSSTSFQIRPTRM
jgi:hypothetical protein